MGRLTLNVLLSFAQFEREVTGERIRDKIAASKKKGLWMGGLPSLGYDETGATLAELIAATGWLPHSARAVLTSLRKRDYQLTLARGERGGASVYRVAASAGEVRR